MAETHGGDIGHGIDPASPSPAPPPDSPGKKFQTLQNPLIFLLAAVCGLFVAVAKFIARVIWTNAWIIVTFLILSAVAGYFSDDYLEKRYSTYTASGTIRILPTQSPDPIHPAPAIDATALEIEKATDAARFHSDGLVDDLMKDVDNPIRQTNWWNVTCGKDPEKARELLALNLDVDLKPGSQLMGISFTAPDKADTAVLVTAVVDRAIRDQRELIRDIFDADRKRIADLRNRYEAELRTAIEDIQARNAELAQLGGTPVLGNASVNGGVAGPKETEINAHVNERVALQAAKFDIDNAIAEMDELKGKGQVPPTVQQMIDEDRNVISTRDKLEDIGMRLGDAQGQGDLKSAAVVQLSEEQEFCQKRLDDLKAQKLDQYLSAYSAQMIRSKKSVDNKLDHCNSEILRLEAQLADIANKTIALKSREEDVNVYGEFVKEYDKGLRDLDHLISRNEIGAMEWFARPRVPSAPSVPDLGRIMTMAILSGLSLSLGIAFLREIVKWGRS